MDSSTQQFWTERAVRSVAQALPAIDWQIMQAYARQCTNLIKQLHMTFLEAEDVIRYLEERQIEHGC